MPDDATHELLKLSQQLLNSIDQQDWKTYSDLCDASLTAFEPEAVGNLVAGLPFHQFYFEMEGSGPPQASGEAGFQPPVAANRLRRAQQSSISSPAVRLMGDAAVVTYVRLTQRIQPSGRPSTIACEETRVWQKQNGVWKHVHFHRSRCGSVEL
jgi:calcium/calmodulin-dependent protein kinase (CaM kinase) II